jgi:hypothetical protein
MVYAPLAQGRGRWPNGAFANVVIEFEAVPEHIVTPVVFDRRQD